MSARGRRVPGLGLKEALEGPSTSIRNVGIGKEFSHATWVQQPKSSPSVAIDNWRRYSRASRVIQRKRSLLL